MTSICYTPSGFKIADGTTGKLKRTFKISDVRLLHQILYNLLGIPFLELNERTMKFSDIRENKRVLRSEMRDLLIKICKRENVEIVWNSSILLMTKWKMKSFFILKIKMTDQLIYLLEVKLIF